MSIKTELKKELDICVYNVLNKNWNEFGRSLLKDGRFVLDAWESEVRICWWDNVLRDYILHFPLQSIVSEFIRSNREGDEELENVEKLIAEMKIQTLRLENHAKKLKKQLGG